MTIYIAGPMTGLPGNNYDAFHAAEERLRLLGWEVVNPARNPKQESWEEYMAISLKQVLEADAVYVLDGWMHSRGAALERQVAYAAGIPVFTDRLTPTLKDALDRRALLIRRAREQADAMAAQP